MDIIWSGYITKENFFEIDKFDDFVKWLGTFAPGTKVDVILKKHEDKTPCSDAQRKYYWKVIVGMIVEHTGQYPEKPQGFDRKHKEEELKKSKEVHEILKYMFLKDYDYISTEELTIREREEYHQKCREWALKEHKILIPLPNEVIP